MKKLLSSVLITLMLSLTVACSRSKDPMPISVTFREAVMDNSLVAKFQNTSQRYITPILNFENATLKEKKRIYIELAPNETKEIGWAEGWKFYSGEYIIIEHEDYKDLKLRVP